VPPPGRQADEITSVPGSSYVSTTGKETEMREDVLKMDMPFDEALAEAPTKVMGRTP